MDEGHLNYIGADMFTTFMWEVFSNDPELNKKFFCQSYEEKMMLDEPEVYGVYFYEDEENYKIATIASNRETEMEYKISILPDGKEEQIIQDYTENKDFILPDNESGEIIIVSRLKSNHEQMTTLKLKY